MISPHFKRSEIACRCGCGFDCFDKELNDVLEELWKHYSVFGNPVVTITSGNRCVSYNERIQMDTRTDYVPFSSKSRHIYGLAADIIVKIKRKGVKDLTLTPECVYNYLDKKYPDKYGIGRYKYHTHIDVRKEKARWQNV